MLLRKTLLRRPDGKAATRGSLRPSARIPLVISVTISGKDAAGHSFKEATRTLEIDRRGALILTSHELLAGSQVSVENTSLGQTVLARVVEFVPRRSRQEPFRAEIELVELPELFETASIWGVKARGKEETGLQTTDSLTSSGAQTTLPSAPPPEPPPSQPAVPEAAPAVRISAQPTTPANSPATLDAIRLAAEDAVAVLQRARLEMQGSLESRAAQHQRQLAEMMDSSVREVERKSEAAGRAALSQLESGLQAALQKALEEFSGGQQTAAEKAEVRSTEDLARQAAATRATAEQLVAEAKSTAASALREFEQRVSGLGTTAAATLAGEAEILGREHSNRLLESFEQRTAVALRNAQGQVESLARHVEAAVESGQSRLLESSEAQIERIAAHRAALQAALQKTISESSESAAASLRAASEGVLTEVAQARQEAESSLAAKTAEAEERYAALANRLGEIANRPAAGRENTSVPVAAHVELRGPELGKALDSFRAQLRLIADESRRGLQASQDQLVQVCQDRLDEACEEKLAAATQSAESRIGAALEARLGPELEAAEKASAELAQAQEKSKSAAISMEAALETASSGFASVERAARTRLTEIEKSAEAARASAVDRLARQAGEVEQQTAESLRVASRTLAEETRKQAAGITGEALESFAQRLGSIGEENLARLRGMLDEFVSRSAEQVRALDDQRLDDQYETAKREKAVLEQLRVDFVRTERRAMRNITDVAKSLTVTALGGLGSGLKFALKAGVGVAAMGAVLVTCLSITPVMRLRNEPPKEFYDEYLQLDTQKRRSEDSLALAYWECARATVEAEYARGKDLPEIPPSDFKVNENIFAGGARVDPASRIRYWARLRLVWLLPQAWEKSYEWHTEWMRNVLGRLSSKAPAMR